MYIILTDNAKIVKLFFLNIYKRYSNYQAFLVYQTHAWKKISSGGLKYCFAHIN